eukprot:890246-Amphidinium_carterae.1
MGCHSHAWPLAWLWPCCRHASCLFDQISSLCGETLSQVEVRKYVDDMVLISSGPGFAGNLCFAYRQVLRSLTAVNMKVNALKTVVLCNRSVTKRKLWQVWRAGRLPPVLITTRDSGVDTQWFAWRNPVQQKRISSFRASMTRALGPSSARESKDGRALGKGALLRRSAAIELVAHGGPSGDPRVAADLSTVRVWQRHIAAGKVSWHLPTFGKGP